MATSGTHTTRRLLTFVLGLGLLLGPPGGSAARAGEPDPAASATLTVLSYNVHGLFAAIAKDTPRHRMPTIGWLARPYDVVLLQEDFEYHRALARQLDEHVGTRGNGIGWSPKTLLAAGLLLPVRLLVPHVSPPYGAGVTNFTRREAALPDDVDRRAYDLCHGWFTANNDCWARKGFLRTAVATRAGTLDVYNTHLESGPGARAVEIRGQQLDLLAEAIEQRPRERALVVAGDLNISFNRPGDGEILRRFRARLGLRDSGAGPELPSWRERSYILVRDGTTTAVEVQDSGEALEFVQDTHALSDHPALYARLRLTSPAPTAEAKTP